MRTVGALAALLASQTAAAELGPPAAMAVNDAARDAWGMCVIGKAADYVSLDERAETIANAVSTDCAHFQQPFEASLHDVRIVNGPALASETIDKIVTTARETFRSRAVSTVLAIRFKRANDSKAVAALKKN